MAGMQQNGTAAADEQKLQSEGVVPHYALQQLTPEALHDGRAPWSGQASSTSELPSYRLGCPPLLIGGSAFGKGIFSDDRFLQSTEPYRIVRLAFDYGIRAIDTSPFYHPSELTLGRILRALSIEYPRHTYYLQTKVGRYGPTRAHFDYSPKRVRSSISTSLERLGTTYLDSAVLHDVEFVCDVVGPSQSAGFAARDVLDDPSVARTCGLVLASDTDDDGAAAAAVETQVHGPGDAAVLAAMQTLFALKDEGVVRNVGIGGYPLPTLLRLSRLIASRPPYRPVDVIVSYCHHTVQNDLLTRYRPLFSQQPVSRRRLQTKHHNASDVDHLPPWIPPMLINASPFGMGLLTDSGPPSWHPASDVLKQSCAKASSQLRSAGASHTSSLASTAAHFGMRDGGETAAHLGRMSTIVGMNSVKQVHQAVETYRSVFAYTQLDSDEPNTAAAADLDADAVRSSQSNPEEKYRNAFEHQKSDELAVLRLFDEAGVRDWSWASP